MIVKLLVTWSLSRSCGNKMISLRCDKGLELLCALLSLCRWTFNLGCHQASFRENVVLT